MYTWEGIHLSDVVYIEGKVTDPDKNRLYTAENVLNFLILELVGPMRIYDCQLYADSIVRSKWWQYRSSLRGVTIAEARKNAVESTSSYPDGIITLVEEHCTKLTICHELTHLIVYEKYEPGHGRKFCQTYLQMVRRFIGPVFAQALAREYSNYNVKWYRLKGGQNGTG